MLLRKIIIKKKKFWFDPLTQIDINEGLEKDNFSA